jgi:hypothetical protein
MCHAPEAFLSVIAKFPDTALSKSLVKVSPNFSQFDYRSVGNGTTKCAWTESWIDYFKIENLVKSIHIDLQQQMTTEE